MFTFVKKKVKVKCMEEIIREWKYDIPAECVVCGQRVYVDVYGHGDCEHCGWRQDKMCLEYPDEVEYPNMVSFNKAKALHAQGLPLKPSLDDFIAGLKYYKEVEFEYMGTLYAVCHHSDDTVCFSEYFPSDNFEPQVYYSYEEFAEKAHIGGKLLKDIWDDVTNADYM